MAVKECVLQTRPLFESHTAGNLSNVLKKAVDDWKIVRCYKSSTGNLVGKPIAITTDNAANIVKAVEIGGFSPHERCFCALFEFGSTEEHGYTFSLSIAGANEKGCYILSFKFHSYPHFERKTKCTSAS